MGIKKNESGLNREFINNQFLNNPILGTGFDNRWRTAEGDAEGFEASRLSPFIGIWDDRNYRCSYIFTCLSVFN